MPLPEPSAFLVAAFWLPTVLVLTAVYGHIVVFCALRATAARPHGPGGDRV